MVALLDFLKQIDVSLKGLDQFRMMDRDADKGSNILAGVRYRGIAPDNTTLFEFFYPINHRGGGQPDTLSNFVQGELTIFLELGKEYAGRDYRDS